MPSANRAAVTDALLAEFERQLASGEPALATCKQLLRDSYDEFAQHFSQGTPASQLVQQATLLTDAVLQSTWSHFLPVEAEASLIAVGGYGRRELHPASDVDVLILTARDPQTLAEHIEPLVMFLWDIGLEIGHSVRSLTQCIDWARNDITVITNLLESRLLAGDPRLFERLQEATAPEQIWPSPAFFSAKADEQRARHAKFEDSGQDLEPNIKESPGGLRDIQTIGWVAKRHFGVSTMQALVDHGFLNDHEYQQIKHGEEFLWQLRYALHLLTGRHEDRLLFEHQRALAQQFGYTDASANLAVEQFMQDYYRHAMQVQRLNEMLLQLFEEAILLGNKLGDPVQINRRFQTRSGYLEVVNPGIFSRYPLAMLELFLVLQQQPQIQGVRASTIRLLRAHRHLIDQRFRDDIRARALFIEIFRQPRGLTHATRRMHRYGILQRYLPAFNAVTGLMQFDLFHVYTVDQHILMVLRNARRFTLEEHSDECPRCSQTFKRLPKPELLYLASLFHDIAKGRGGDHSELGANDARKFCQHHALSTHDAELVAWLVENHLVMSRTAQHSDIDDPEVIQAFAMRVGTPVRLDYLYLLTVADMRGTNPKRWNSWKAALLDHLHTRTEIALERGLEQPREQEEVVSERQEKARAQLVQLGYDDHDLQRLWQSLSTDYFLQNSADAIVWHTQLLWPPGKTIDRIHVELRCDTQYRCTELFLYGPDRDDLFAHTTALLDQLSLNVLGARIQATEGGLSINSYLLLEEDGSQISGNERLREIRYFVEDRLNGGEPPTGCPRIPRQLQSFQTQSEISFEQDAGRGLTRLTLKTSGRPGLLSLVGQAFAAQRLRVHNARIATAGAEARDTFAITDRQDRPIDDPKRLAAISEAIRSILDD